MSEHNENVGENNRERLERDLLSVWSLVLPPDHNFEKEKESIEISIKLRDRIRAFAKATLDGIEHQEDPGIVALVYRFRSIYEEYGRMCLDEYLRSRENG